MSAHLLPVSAERLRAELRGDQAHIAAAARARERDEALAEVDRLRIERDRYIREAESLRAAAESAGDAAHAILLDAIGGLVAGSTHGGDVVGLATIAAQEIASAWEAIGTPPAGTLAGAIRRIREGDYSRGQLSAILGRREGELTREAAARVVTERDEARAELARASHILAVERGDASRAPPGWHFDGMAWWRNDEPRRPIVLVCRRAGERRPASVWYRPGIDADADGPEFATALEAMEAEGAAQGDS